MTVSAREQGWRAMKNIDKVLKELIEDLGKLRLRSVPVPVRARD
jgi:hypothetical protein